MKALRVLKKIGKVILTIVLVIAIGLTVALNIKTVLAAHKNKDVIAAGTSVPELTIPAGVQIVGLGEATHGTAEFHESKLEVLQLLVEKYDYRAIAIEDEFADCLRANAYINGANGDARTIANNFAFTIYHTQQMADLLDWMREYNASVPEDKRLRFYGFDMQNPEKGVPELKNFIEKNGLNCSTACLERLADPELAGSLSKEDVASVIDELSVIEEALRPLDDEDFDVICMRKVVENIRTAMDYYQVDPIDSYNYRDTAMAANVTWLLELEQKIGSGKLMLAGHNAHTGKAGTTAMFDVTMGSLLKDQYGDAYYSLGTDFFKGSANIRVEIDPDYSRKDYHLHSADPMAYQAKYMPDGKYFLDFTSLDATEDKAVYDMVHSEMSMCSVGEGFSAINYFFHWVYRLNMVPTDLYDGMIFYYDVHATQPEIMF